MKPIVTEKAVRLIEAENALVFETDRRKTKKDIKKELEDVLKIKITKINSLVKHNKKYAYVKIDKKTPAIDIATKLGLI